MANAVMLLSNPFRPDPRVLKEARSLVEKGHQVTIIAWDRAVEYPAKDMLPPGVQVIRIQTDPSQYGIGIRQIARLFRFWRSALTLMNQIKPELVHCHDFDTLPAGLFWGKRFHCPVIYDAHEYYAEMVRPRLHGIFGKPIYLAMRKLEQIAARQSQAVITVDEPLAAYYHKFNPNILVIGHYPPLEFVSKASNAFTKPEINLLYAGRLSVDRGLLLYLDILRWLHENSIFVRLILAGVFTPASEEIAFREKSKDLSEWIDVTGWVTYQNLPSIYNKADVGLCLLQPEPRYVAAIPVKLFEYMAAGLPVLASDFPQIRQLVASENCGALIDPTDSHTAAETIIDWLRNPHTAQQFGENGRRAILREYNWKSLADKLDKLYRELSQ